jgi:hypothetical protein
MGSDFSTSSSVLVSGGVWAQLKYWFLLEGDRTAVTGCIVVIVVLVGGTLVALGVVDVGPNGSAATLFGSGITSGVVTLVTIALSINQLILTRVFGSPGELDDRLEGTRELRRSVENLAGEPSSPTDPAGFLSMLARTLQERTTALLRAIDASEWNPPDEATDALRTVADYGDNVDDSLSEGTNVVEVLEVVLGDEYARNLAAVRHLQNEHADALSADVRTEFRAVVDLLERIAVTRQFFKTIALQRDFAHLSIVIVYSGLLALVVAISLTLVYRTNSVTIPADLLPAVVSVGLGVIVAPLAAFMAHIFRAATIASRTLSVGSFVPPDEP